MRRSVFSLLVFIFVLVALNPCTIEASEDQERYIIGLKEGVPLEEFIQSRVDEPIIFESIHAFSSVLTKEERDEWQNDERVAYIEPDAEVKVSSQQIPWGVNKLNAPSVWNHGLTGKGVKVAVIDTGVDQNHQDLQVKNKVSFVEYTTSAKDDHGHGTHVAGIISAKNNQLGVVGVAHDAELYAVKALDKDGNGFISNVIKGVEWAMNEQVDIINLSLGASRYNSSFERVLDQAYEQGILIVGAAGNGGTTTVTDVTIEYPAAYQSVIAVGAVDSQNRRPTFSATGSGVEVAAPGVQVYSTTLNNQYKYDSGTSMAAPHVSGHLALLKEAFPNRSNAELRKMLHQQVVDLEPKGRDAQFGYGLVRLPSHEALVTVPPLNVRVEDDVDRQKVRLQWTANQVNNKGDFYHIYRNGKKIKRISSDESTYLDLVEEGTYTYYITSLYDGGKESKRSNAITITVKEKGAQSTISFTDIEGDEWYAPHLYNLAYAKILEGFPDGTIRPTVKVTREQAAVMIARALNEELIPYELNTYQDVTTNRYSADAIQTMTKKAILEGYPDRVFKPENQITRGEVALILSRAFTLEKVTDKQFTDLNSDYFAHDAIVAIGQAGVSEGYEDGSYRASQSIGRAEFSAMLNRILEIKKPTP